MKQVRTSSLSKIKTVFDSTDSNVFHFDGLNKSFNQNEFGVELAQPIVRYSNNVVQWKAKATSELLPFNVLSKEEQDSVAQIIQQTFTDFKERTSIQPESFYANIMEIPGSDSLLVGTTSDGYEIVITDWGFLEDTIDRQTGVLYQLFPVPNFSVLARLKDRHGKLIPNEEIRLEAGDVYRGDLTDLNGCARLGELMRGSSFILKSNSGCFEAKDFSADGRSFYDIMIKESVILSFRVKNGEGLPIANYHLEYSSPQHNKIQLKTNSIGLAEVIEVVCIDRFFVNKDKVLFNEVIPDKDTLYDIVIEEEKKSPPIVEPDIPVFIEEDLILSPVSLVFLNRFGKAISGLNVEVKDSKGKISIVKETDKEGRIEIDNLEEGNYEVKFTRRSSQWNYSFDHKLTNEVHEFCVKPIYPWLWWLCCLIVLALLICCTFFNCICELRGTSNSIDSSSRQYEQKELNATPNKTGDETESNLTEEINEEIIPCNIQQKSGSAGITMNNHELGEEAGIVKIAFDMQEIPDKLEVFYEGKLVASTFEIQNNIDGFVGASLSSGCCGLLSFNYVPEDDKFCTVKITGNYNTEWIYGVGCPE
jgi:hypothetical protein